MRYMNRSFCLLAVLGACERQPVSPVISELMSTAQVTTDTHSRAVVTFADSVSINGTIVAAGIRGDGRNVYGQNAAPLNQYQGDFCGVRGFIYDQKGESGALEFDPDTYYLSTMAPACGSSRSISFFLAGPSSQALVASPHILGTVIWPLKVGEIRIAPQRFGMQQTTTCGELDFDAQYSGSNNIAVSRLPDTLDSSGLPIRRWKLASQGNHTAACVKMQNNGKFVDSGLRYYLPFTATITQVRYPSPTFP